MDCIIIENNYHFCSMDTFYHSSGEVGCPVHGRTASTWADMEEKNYLATVNYQLVNQINQTATEKHFYRTKLSQEFRTHHDELQQAFRIISEKNTEMIALQQQLDLSQKDIRSAADDYIALKRTAESENQALHNQMVNNKTTFDEKVRKMEEQFQLKCELKIKKRVQQVENQCSDRVKLFTDQIQVLTENSKRLTHELSMLQEDYRQILLKNDTIIQESIHRELRKRDFEAQNNYLRDLAQYQTIKKDKNQLKEQLTEQNAKNDELEASRKKLMARIQVQSQRVKDLEEVLQSQKVEQKEELFKKYPEYCQVETNTDKQFVPIAMPIDMNLMSQVASLRQFLIQKLMTRFVDFFQQTAGKQKKTSKSLLVFNNCLTQLKRDSADLKILLFMHGTIEKIVKVYCPSLNNHSRQFLTVKDEFIRKTLIECETISNHSQRLFRLLDLVFRLKNPLNHLKAELSAGELKLLQMKLLICLKKNFS